MRVGIDATPLLGPRTGVGQYVGHLVGALAELPVDLTLTAFTSRGAGGLADAAGTSGASNHRQYESATSGSGSGASRPRVVHRPFPARALQALWQRVPFPPVELLAGRSDVFHATNFVLPPTLRARGVVTVHDLTFLRFPELVSPASLRYRTLVPRSVRRAAVVITPSYGVAAEVAAELGVAEDKIVTTPLGVDPSWSAAQPLDDARREALGVPERYVLFVGTREPRKRLPDLLAAHRAARAADPQVPPLVLAGPAGWGQGLDDDQADGSVVRTGYLELDLLQGLVAGAACLVLPSAYEGFGLPVLEALACGTRVVASDVPAHRETGADLVPYVPVGDVDRLAELVIQATTTPDEPAARTERRARAETFTWRLCAELTLQAYERATA